MGNMYIWGRGEILALNPKPLGGGEDLGNDPKHSPGDLHKHHAPSTWCLVGMKAKVEVPIGVILGLYSTSALRSIGVT